MVTMQKKQQLSRQEERVLSLARQGLGDKQIAVELGLSTDTVRTYWQRIRQKVGAATRAEIVATISEKQTAAALEAVESEKNVLLQEILRRRSVERALRVSEQEWRQLADSMPQIVFVSSPSLDIYHFNARFYSYTGLGNDEALEGGWRRVLHPDDETTLEGAKSKSMPYSLPLEAEVRLRRHDGEYRWHICKAVPQLDEKGIAGRYFGTATEIHESRVLRDRLQASATFLTQAQQVARLGSFEYDVRANLSHWSETLFDIYGVEPQSGWFETEEFVKGIHPEDLPNFGQAIRDIIDNQVPFSERYRYRRPDGQIIHVLSVAKPVVEDGRVVRLVGTVQDITELAEFEQKLRDSERLLKAAEEIAGLGSFSWDVAEASSVWSLNMFKLFERRTSDGVPTAEEFFSLLHPDDHDEYRDKMAKTIATGQPFRMVYRLVFGERLKWIQTLGSPELKDRKVVRLIGTCQDVTEQRRINAEIERRNEQLRYAEVLAEFGSYVYDLASQTYEWSENLYAIHNHDPRRGPMLPAEFRDRLHPDDRHRYDETRRKLYEQFEPVSETYNFLSSTGEWKILHAKASPILEHGKLARVLGTVQDITP